MGGLLHGQDRTVRCNPAKEKRTRNCIFCREANWSLKQLNWTEPAGALPPERERYNREGITCCAHMSLLTPAESHAFQSFLSALDYTDLSPSEWALLNSTTVAPEDDLLGPDHSSELLTKATKDLMALDSGYWGSLGQQPHGLPSQQSQQQQHQAFSNAFSHRQMSYSRHETFPFLNTKAHLQQSTLSYHPDLQTHHLSPTETSAPTSDTTTTTLATPQSPFGLLDPPTQVQLNHRQRPSSPGTKRSSSRIASGPSKRLRPSPPAASSSSASSSTKQTLLSPSQKKANHIQSEQKRRANIRRGYEALCDTVPALREAIREEEEADTRMNASVTTSGKPSRSKRKKKDAGEDSEKDKIDGRTGPRSENIVLSKSRWRSLISCVRPFMGVYQLDSSHSIILSAIEYINELLSDRSSLLARLERARSALPSDHPALSLPCKGEPLWERQWKSSQGRIDDDDEDDGDSS